jgi:O-antigen/teichoic acid export membrane protein
VTPVVSASASYTVRKDAARARDLLLRGSRYTLAATVPLTIAVMILARPILRVWLGPRFAVASTAMIILVSYWLVNGSTGVAGRMLIAVGRVRTIAVYAGAVAIVNLALSLALTPSLGLNGVVLGTAVAYLLAFPVFVWITVSTFPVRLAELSREVWLPAYSTGVVMSAGLLAVRLSVPLDSVPSVVAAAAVAVLAYWVTYYVVWLRPSERVLVKAVARAALLR